MRYFLEVSVIFGQPTWNDSLAFFSGVVAHEVVSTGEHESLFVQETHVVSDACPKSEEEMTLGDDGWHDNYSCRSFQKFVLETRSEDMD